MKREQWRRVEALFHAALERPPDGRRAFLDDACGEASELRRKVETLLSKDEQAGSFLEKPILADITTTLDARGSLVGQECGPYQILSSLGAGGMGEVYRAYDTTLGRYVAIKTLPAEFARDPARLARLRREARTLAALNHPNVAAIYGLQESPDLHGLVLELVEGETLHGPLPLATALDFADQVADALEGAHERGIIHRDLKPGNVRVTPQGRVKVLDFGLAKAIWGTEEQPDLAQPPATGDGTVTGQILGTPGYMSPEQARGAEVDQRTDIWAFGCLLYELLAGRRVFECRTVPETMTAVLGQEPDWRALPARTPAKIRDLLRRCLEKEPSRRLNNMADVRAALRELQRGHPPRSAQNAPGAPVQERRRAAPRVDALAVLPLANVTGDPEQDYFADGMTEALIAELAQIRALRVISRTSAMHYRGSTKTMPEIARELSVDGIIEGAVMRAGDRVRITAQLIHAATDRHLWARSYERDLRDVLQLQGEVARAIADEIQVTLTPQERARLARVRDVNVESHEAVLRGHFHWSHAHPDRAIEHFQRAIAIDPENAAAYAGMADAQCMLFSAAVQAVAPIQMAPLARAAALKALKLDDSLAEPHVSLARVLFWHDRDPVGAERELRRAIGLNPNCAMAHFHRGLLYADLARHNESIAAFQRCFQLDPVSFWHSAIAGWVLYEIGQEETGRQLLQQALELNPGIALAWSASGILHCYEGRFADAVAEVQEGVRLSGRLSLTLGWAAYVLAMAGRRGEALAILDELESLSRQRYVPATARAWACAGLGDYERVVQWFENGYRQRDSVLPHVGMFRAFKPLHPDPRFQDLLRRLSIAP
jgi:TolB-like protein/Tfp pilus assembly protein PilF